MMTDKKINVGDARPVYRQVGWEVCKEIADDPSKEVWVAVEKEVEKEILSHIFKNAKKE